MGLREDIENAAAQVNEAEAGADSGSAAAVAVPAVSSGEVGAAGGSGGDGSTGDGGVGDVGAAPVNDKPRDEAGRFAPKTEAPLKPVKVAAKTGTPAPKEGAASPTPAPQPGAASPTPAPLKPPQSWKATEREKWAALPPEIQAVIDRREREIAKGMQEGATHRETAEAFRKTIAPYEPLMRARGIEPTRYVGELLQTAAALNTAPPERRAEIVAGLVQSFQVPPVKLVAGLINSGAVSIDAVNAALSQPQQPAPAEYRDPRFDAFMSDLQRAKQMKAQQENQALQQKVDAFSEANEFFGQVRARMAGIIDADPSLADNWAEAYSQACWADPDVRATLQQREAAKAAENAQASTQRAKQAASSVKSKPAGDLTSHQPKTLREDIEAAIAAAGGR